MIGDIGIVGVRTYAYTDLINRISIERDGTLFNAISGCIVAESVMAECGLTGVGAFTDALLILI